MSGLQRLQALYHHIVDHQSVGAYWVDKSLGAVSMIEGYALMLNGDRTHYYWLRFDGSESAIDWNKWRVRRGAKVNRARHPELFGED